MRFLLFALHDSYNFTIASLARTAIDAGHSITIAIQRLGHDHTWMFQEIGANIVRWNEQELELSSYDICIYESIPHIDVRKKLKSAKIPMISMAYHFPADGFILGPGFSDADCTITLGPHFSTKLTEFGNKLAFHPLGSPQYDSLAHLSKPQLRKKGDTKTILFLEQHFYPACLEGKQELASTLSELARTNPQKNFVIKPRTLPSSLHQATHRAPHLYDFIEEEFSNLVLLDTHKDLMDTVLNADLVISHFSTAIFAAIAHDKPIAFWGDLPNASTDAFSIDMIEEFFKTASDITPVVNSAKLNQMCQEGGRPLSAKLRKDLLSDFLGNSGLAIIDLASRIAREGWQFIDRTNEHHRVEMSALALAYDLKARFGKQKQDWFLSTKRKLELLTLEHTKSSRPAKDLASVAQQYVMEEREKIFEEAVKTPDTLHDAAKGAIIHDLFLKGDLKKLEAMGSEFDIPDRSLAIAQLIDNVSDARKAKKHYERYLEQAESEPFSRSQKVRNHIIDFAKERLSSLKS